MENTKICRPKGYEVQTNRREELKKDFLDGVTFVREHLKANVDSLPPQHREAVKALFINN